MADMRDADEIVSKFLHNTCLLRQRFSTEDQLLALHEYADMATLGGSPDSDQTGLVLVTTGSVAEFYIQPMLSCVGDVDIMVHFSHVLAIPAGTAPPTQLPGEFDSRVEVCQIIDDSNFPGYVYLVMSYLLTECTEDGHYNAVQCIPRFVSYEVDDKSHGPALLFSCSCSPFSQYAVRLAGSHFSRDAVYCFRCLSWPPQADDWPTRQRKHGWPDSATVDRVVSHGCDVVSVAHRRWKRKRHIQHRLSFSRAEIILLNSWIPVQQILYHMLRVFVKTEQSTASANNSGAATLSNYHIKTLMLWACELKPSSWWIDDLNVVRLCVELLRVLGVWLTDARCKHYFIHNCNLFDRCDDECCSQGLAAKMLSLTRPTTNNRLQSEAEASLTEWFIDNYIRICAQLCPGNVSRLFDDVSNSTKLEKAVSAVVVWRLNTTLRGALSGFITAQFVITRNVSRRSLTARSCLGWIRELTNTDQSLSAYFTAVTLLHVAYKSTSDTLKDELLDVLTTTFLQSDDVGPRHYVNARLSSVLSLRLASHLMKVVTSNSHSTAQLIEIELSKAYLSRALKNKDSHSDSIYCLANVYLAVLYYCRGHYQTATDHCTLVMRSQNHSQCSSRVVQGELLPKIDDNIDTVLGLAVFYQYVRTAALNQQQTQRVRVFTTELFAHYLHVRCVSVVKNCHPLTQTPLTAEVQRYQKCFYELQEVFISDVLLLHFVNCAEYPSDDHRQMVVSDHTVPGTSHQLDTSELVELLQQSAVEHLTTFRQVEAQQFSGTVATDFEALFAFKCGDYQRCLWLSTQNVHTLTGAGGMSRVIAYPEFIQLMDDDIVSLTALTLIVNPSCRGDTEHILIHQLPLSLYLMAQCHIKLRHPITSLILTLHYVDAGRRNFGDTLDQLLLKLTIRKILLHIGRESLLQR